jgi:non-specific serine/threonine protein kinase
MALAAGTHLGPYEIEAPLGAGGMGEVYRARDTRLGRHVALKVLRPDAARDSASRGRFESEARAISRLNHPHICVLYDVGRERLGADGTECDFLVMELVDGEPLTSVLARGPLPAAHVVRNALEIAAALEDAHGHDVVHGDLKPGNVMATRFGLKLLDFGLARQLCLAAPTDASNAPTEVVSPLVAGTLPYMAPELLRGAPCDARSDLWALGVVAHEMATGSRPFTGETSFELSAAILGEPPVPPPVWVPPGLQTIIQRCLAKRAEDRYQHASELRAALEVIQSDPSIAPPAPAAPHNLPLQLTRFIGREREIAEVRPLVSSDRLVTLTGAGGAGKTRLALEVVDSLVGSFQHGVWLIELATLTDPDLIPNLVASTLGLRADASKAMTDVLLEYLRPRQALLVLDNCEHVIDASATLASQILRVCPRVHILGTSREALGVTGERAWRVPSLALPPMKSSDASGSSSASSDAVRFFVDRAQAVAPHFAPTPETIPVVAHICYRLDGIPLALELAAARMKVLSVEQISSRLDDRFHLLTGGSRTAVPRQQTLRATIDWSYDLLSEPERRLLRRLSVFAGGCSLEAVEQICGASDDADPIETLSRLVDKSLVGVDEDSARGSRYRLLETVRQYARDRLFESGEAAALRDRHFAFFERLTLEAEDKLTGADQIAWADRLADDYENLRAALEWGLASAERKDKSLRIVSALWNFWSQRNYFSEGRQWVERALIAAPNAPPAIRARTMAAGADLSYLGGDYRAARGFCDQVLALEGLQPDDAREPMAFAWFILSVQAFDRQDLEEAQALTTRTAALADGAAPTALLCLSQLMPAFLAYVRGDLQRARALLEDSVSTLRVLGDKWVLNTILFNLSLVLLAQGEIELAKMACREGVAHARALGDGRALTWCLAGLALAAADEQSARRAARLWGAAEGVSESIASPLPPFLRQESERHLPRARQALGDREFAAAWAEGRQLSTKAAVAYALE